MPPTLIVNSPQAIAPLTEDEFRSMVSEWKAARRLFRVLGDLSAILDSAESLLQEPGPFPTYSRN